MKAKTQKKNGKREMAENGEDKKLPPAKKPKTILLNGTAESEDEAPTAAAPSTQASRPATSVDNSIFQHFKELTSPEEAKRMQAALNLLLQLSRSKDEEKQQKELKYTLKRLIRGCGASTNTSRAGFFTGLVAFLKAFSDEKVSTDEVLTTAKKELNVGSTISNKEDADAVVGKILTCGALLHAGRIATASHELLERVTNTLLKATRHRTYHASLGFSFVIELVEKLTEVQFTSSVWPLLSKELARPWPKQTLQTVHCLIVVKKKFPNIVDAKFLKSHYGGADLLNPESYTHLYKIFWEHSDINLIAHPAFEVFGAHIANSAHLKDFWTETVDPGLHTTTKLTEFGTLKIATDILNNIQADSPNVVDLLSKNLLIMLISGLKNLKLNKDETLRAFYNEFFEALVNCCSKLTQSAQKVAIIQRLIMPPSIFDIEKYTSTRIVHQLINFLDEQGIKDIFELYKGIFLETTPKTASESWTNFERLNAGYTLQHLLTHKAVKDAYKWRQKQLKFLFTCGIFHVDGNFEICKKEAASSFSTDFGEQCKNMFYASLQSKVSDLQHERKLLFSLVNHCQESLVQKQTLKCLRLKPQDDVGQKAWKSMFEVVAAQEAEFKSHKKEGAKKLKSSQQDADKLQLVFHILLLNMGLQLFKEPEMAAPAIDDLLKCMQRTKEPQKRKRKLNMTKEDKEEDSEPEWIEVIVDLFLHLLSQNASALRNIVNTLFPHFCGNLTLSAIHEILSMLDMKDGNNPLSAKGEDEDEDDEENQEEEEENDSGAESAEDESDAEEADSDDDGDDDDDEGDDDDESDAEEEEEEVITAADKLRNVISQALIETGGAATVDDDMESVDLNDMTEEEGRKLNEALSNAFKALKKTTGSAAQNKKSKSYRAKTTTVMHFRIRVLDLIEIYLQHTPTLIVSIEIMLALFNMLEFCISDELRPLQQKVERVLQHLTALKSFTPDSDLKESHFVDFIRLIMEKKSPALAFDLINKMRNKCVLFLITQSSKVAADGVPAKVVALCKEYFEEFIKSRNPALNITLISDIFKLRWQPVWDLAHELVKKGVSLETRTYRRIQINEILLVLYKNWELHKLNQEVTKQQFKKIEAIIASHVRALNSTEGAKQSLREFHTLLELILQVHKSNLRLRLTTCLSSPETCNEIQKLRRLIRLDNVHLYQRYCTAFKLQLIRNNESEETQQALVNGTQDPDSEDEATQTKKEKKKAKSQQRPSEVTTTATKRASKDLRKEKKLKKQQRMEAASRGMNGGLGFVQPTDRGGDSDSA